MGRKQNTESRPERCRQVQVHRTTPEISHISYNHDQVIAFGQSGQIHIGTANIDGKVKHIAVKTFDQRSPPSEIPWLSERLLKKRAADRQNELSILQELSGTPHIITLYKAEYDEGSVQSIIMEKGEATLQNILDNISTFEGYTDNQKKSIIFTAIQHGMKALKGVHIKGIAHKDMATRNILLCEDGFKIIDFGDAQEKDVSPKMMRDDIKDLLESLKKRFTTNNMRMPPEISYLIFKMSEILQCADQNIHQYHQKIEDILDNSHIEEMTHEELEDLRNAYKDYYNKTMTMEDAIRERTSRERESMG